MARKSTVKLSVTLEPHEVTVPADVVDGVMAVHRAWDPEGTVTVKDGWIVTHVRTGLRADHGRTLAEAQALAAGYARIIRERGDVGVWAKPQSARGTRTWDAMQAFHKAARKARASERLMVRGVGPRVVSAPRLTRERVAQLVKGVL